MRRIVEVFCATSLMPGLMSGCAELNSIHHNTLTPTEGAGQIMTVDAKQRHLIMMPEMKEDAETKWRVCAEAAPDVFSAYAMSAAAKGDKTGGQFGMASAETAATIERTQTINLIRESLYRTCERYASDALSKTSFVVQAARDQRSMIAILAIEQLTGAVRPKSTVISPGGTAATSFSGEAAAQLLRDAQKRVSEAEAASEEANKALEKAKKSGGVCAPDSSTPTDCQALEQTASDKKTDLTKAQEASEDAVALSRDLISAATARTAGQSLQGGEVGTSAIDRTNLAAVSWAVTNIVKMANINEPLMFCLARLGANPKEYVRKAGEEVVNLQDISDNNKDIIKMCSQIMKQQQDDDANYMRTLDVRYYDEFFDGGGRSVRYQDFKSDLLKRMNSVTDADFPKKLPKFETALGTSFSMAKVCSTKQACLTFVASRGNDPYKSDFNKDEDKALSALDAWTK